MSFHLIGVILFLFHSYQILVILCWLLSLLFTEPSCYAKAVSHPFYREAMDKEPKALELNDTRDLVDLHLGKKKKIGCKWVFKVKLHADGTLQVCEARLASKGFN